MRRLQFLLMFMAALFAPVNGKGEGSHTRNQKKQSRSRDSAPPSPAAVVNQNWTTPNANQPPEHSSSYLKRLFGPENLPNILLFGVGSSGVAVAIFTLRAINNQAVLMKRQADEMARQSASTIAQNRAWLTVVDVEAPGFTQKVKNNWIRVGFGFNWSVRNCGNSPAFITRIGARWHLVKNFDELPLQPDIECGDDLAMPTDHFLNGLSIAPGESIERYTLGDGDWSDVREGGLIALAYGVIEYRTALHGEELKTMRFCFRYMPNSPYATFSPSDMPAEYTDQT